MAGVSPKPEQIEEWTGKLAAAKNRRDTAQQEAKEADLMFRQTIQAAAAVGLSAPQIAEAVKLSTYRVYQIKNGRRT